jgi:hypothetical protein
MTPAWNPDADVTPTPGEVEMMAVVLEGRHGVHAEHVAQFFADMNAQKGDASRSWAWAAVTARVRLRTDQRIGQTARP